MPIPDAAVKSALDVCNPGWSRGSDREGAFKRMRATLEATAPQLIAAAWDSSNPDVGPRCPECRVGLGTHDTRDPLCIDYRTPDAV